MSNAFTLAFTVSSFVVMSGGIERSALPSDEALDVGVNSSSSPELLNVSSKISELFDAGFVCGVTSSRYP